MGVVRIVLALLLVVVQARSAPGQDAGPHRVEPTISSEEREVLKQVLAQEPRDLAGAIERLRRAIRPGSSAALDFALGVLLAKNGRTAEAESSLSSATRKLESFARAWDQLGRVRLLLSRPREAAAALAKAIEHGRSSAEIWKLLGRCHLDTERIPAAISAYRRALALAPENGSIRRGLVTALLTGDRHREAIPLLEDLCAEEPQRGDLWLLLANAHLRLEDDDGALTVLETARRLGSLPESGLLTLGDLCYQKGLYDLAATRYGELPDGSLGADRRLNCAEALFFLGRHEEAEATLDRVRAEKPSRPCRIHLLDARIAGARGQTDRAKEAYGKALDVDPLEGEAMLGLARLLIDGKELERARIVLERATRTEGHRLTALVLLAELEVERGGYDEAVKHLVEAVELGGGPALERYLDQVKRIARIVSGH